MLLKEVINILEAEITVGGNLDIEILSACGSDLMSDVLAYVKHQGLLLTGLNNPQVIRTSEMMDIAAIVFVRGKTPSEEVIKLATSKHMVILTTKYPMYTACGLLYSKGLLGGVIH